MRTGGSAGNVAPNATPLSYAAVLTSTSSVLPVAPCPCSKRSESWRATPSRLASPARPAPRRGRARAASARLTARPSSYAADGVERRRSDRARVGTQMCTTQMLVEQEKRRRRGEERKAEKAAEAQQQLDEAAAAADARARGGGQSASRRRGARARARGERDAGGHRARQPAAAGRAAPHGTHVCGRVCLLPRVRGIRTRYRLLI